MSPRASLVRAFLETEFFRGVEEVDVSGLVRAAISHQYRPGEEIMAADEAGDGLFLVLQGSARTVRTSLEGDELTIAELGPGEGYGVPFVAQEMSARSALIAANRTTVLHVPREAFTEFLASHAIVAYRAVEVLARRYALLADRLEEMAFCTVRKRLARELVRQVERTRSRYVDVTHEQLASRIGTKRLEVTRGLAPYRDRRVVKSAQGRRGLIVLDIEQLRRDAGESL